MGERTWEWPPFPDHERPCRICGKPSDHIHFRFDPERDCNVVVEEPDEDMRPSPSKDKTNGNV